MLRRPLPVALLLALAAQLLFSYRIAVPHTLVFDEVHYVPAARALLALEPSVNTEHPLFGKALIALGMAIFGDNSLGWRAIASVAATGAVLAIFAITWLLFRRVRTAAIAAVLATLNFTLFVQARIAMLDGFMASLTVTALAMLLWAAEARTPRAAWTRWTGGAVLMGLAIGTKWTVVPYLGFVGLGLLLVRWRDARAAGRPVTAVLSGREQPHWPGMAAIPAGLVLGLVAALVYALTFLPAFFYARDPLTLGGFLPFQKLMYARQTQVLASHPYQSNWLTWPWDYRAIWYLYEPVDGAQRGILFLGNPAVMWGGLVAVLAGFWAALRDRSLRVLAPAALWLCSWGMWGLIPKSLGFLYYYYLSSLFLPIAIAAAFHRFGSGRRGEGWDEWFLIAAGVLFVWFYPIIAATELSGPQAFLRWMWFDSWV